MSTLKVDAIRSTSGTTDAITLSSTAGVTAINQTGFARNLIINGAQNVAQRALSSTTTGSYACDRFKVSFAGEDEDPTYAQAAITSADTGPWAKGFRNCLQITNGNQTSVGNADSCEIQTKLEAQDIAHSGWDYTSTSSYITLSFWVFSSVAQNFYGFLSSGDGTAQAYIFETGSLSANTWTKITKTIPGVASGLEFADDNGEGLIIKWIPFYGTDFTATPALNTWAAYSGSARTPANTSTWWDTDHALFKLTGVQLEVGKTASEFSHLSYADDLRKCQRYCYVHADGSVATDSSVGLSAFYNSSFLMVGISFPVTMRAKPTLVQTTGYEYYKNWDNGGDDTFNDWTHLYSESLTCCALQAESNLSGTAGHGGRCQLYNASAKLTFEAEL